MTMRLLVWPETADGRPLEPDEPGWVIGWKIDDDTTVVVVAGILRTPIDDDDHKSMIVGRWESRNGESLENKCDFASFCSTLDGPWWKNVASEPQQKEQLVLYRRDGDVCYRCSSVPWISGLFPKLLWYMNEASMVMERIKEGESIVVVEYNATCDDISDDDGGGDRRQPSNDDDKHDDAGQQNKLSLSRRFRRFVAKNSMVVHYWKNAGRFFFDRIPLVQLLALKRIRHETDKSPSRQDEIDTYVERFNEATSTFLNMILGIMAGVLLFYHTDHVQTILQQMWRACYQELLRNSIQWLETFPAGFKLNVPLTQNMGREIIMLIGVYDSTCTVLWSLLSQVLVLQAVAFTSIVFGFTALIALLHDLLILSTLHIAIIATCFRVMHQTQLYLLGALWRLFRGRKRNVLRHRTDTMEYDSMQLLLGMLLFTAVLFLFTTILVYYAFFAVLYLIVQAIGVGLWFMYVSVRLLPLGKCMLRAKHPGWFTERVYLENLLSESRTVTRVVPVYESFGSILSSPLMRYVAAVLSSLPSFLVQVLAGKPCTVREVCLSS